MEGEVWNDISFVVEMTARGGGGGGNNNYIFLVPSGGVGECGMLYYPFLSCVNTEIYWGDHNMERSKNPEYSFVSVTSTLTSNSFGVLFDFSNLISVFHRIMDHLIFCQSLCTICSD